MNQVCLMGRVVRDPELRKTQNDISVASFTLAVDRAKSGGDGERKTDFIDCVAWRHTADFVCKWFPKGKLCAVTGHLQIDEYEDKDGNKRRNARVVAESVFFCGDKAKGGDGNNNTESAETHLHSTAKTQGVDIDASDFEVLDDDGDLPF